MFYLLIIRVNYEKIFILITIQNSFLSSYKNILICSLVRTASIGAKIKSPEMLKFVPDHLKTKTSENAVKKFQFLTVYVPDQYKSTASRIKKFFIKMLMIMLMF